MQLSCRTSNIQHTPNSRLRKKKWWNKSLSQILTACARTTVKTQACSSSLFQNLRRCSIACLVSLLCLPVRFWEVSQPAGVLCETWRVLLKKLNFIFLPFCALSYEDWNPFHWIWWLLQIKNSDKHINSCVCVWGMHNIPLLIFNRPTLLVLSKSLNPIVPKRTEH